jgi:hypothetical protein
MKALRAQEPRLAGLQRQPASFPTEAESHGALQELHYTGVVTVVTCILIAAPHNAGASRVPVSLI